MEISLKGFKIFENVVIDSFHFSGKAKIITGKNNIYVNNGIPSEIVTVKIPKRHKKSYLAGEIIEYKTLSDKRIISICPHASVCGGCNWMHIKYQDQLLFKKDLVKQALNKYNLTVHHISDVFPSPEILSYRYKLDFAVFADENNRLNVGFHPFENAMNVFSVETCYLFPKALNDMIKSIVEYMNNERFSAYEVKTNKGYIWGLTIRRNISNQVQIILHLTKNNPIIIEKLTHFFSSKFSEIISVFFTIGSSFVPIQNRVFIHTYGQKVLNHYLNNNKLQVSPLSFFQPNLYVVEPLYCSVIEFVSTRKLNVVYDLYTGIGSIALKISKYACKVIGIENNKESIRDAIENAKNNDIHNVIFECGDVLQTFTKEFIEKHGKPSLIILDPPRAGTLIETLKTILWAEPEYIIYVSCNMVSLAWNLTYLVSTYDIVDIQLYDMFPQTQHLESVVLLQKKV